MGIAADVSAARMDALVGIMQELLKQKHTLYGESRELMNQVEHLLSKASQLSWLSHQAVWWLS